MDVKIISEGMHCVIEADDEVLEVLIETLVVDDETDANEYLFLDIHQVVIIK